MSQQVQIDTNYFHQIQHPLIQHKLALLRNNATDKKQFKELVHEISLLLIYEATRQLALQPVSITTPLTNMTAYQLAGKEPLIIPILRAGLGMVDAFLTLMPQAKVGHIGLFRDEKTLKPHRYYFKIPKDHDKRTCFVCDPMLATGGSAVAAIDELKKAGVSDFIFICLVSAPEGVANLQKHHPNMPIYAASLDDGLNKDSYILPGLGDAGDRIFGTL